MSSDIPDMLVRGRRELVCGEVVKAVETFQIENGDLHESLAEPNLLYGTALLELARMESTVLGNALEGVPEEETACDDEDFIEECQPMTGKQSIHNTFISETEKEDLSDQVIDAMCEPEKDTEESAAKQDSDTPDQPKEEVTASESGDQVKCETEINPTANDDPDSGLKSEESINNTEVDEKVDAQEGSEENSPDTSKIEGDTEEEDEVDEDSQSEEVTNLQLAWECIEVSKQIFAKCDSTESQLKVADCLEKLAEISREKEDYEKSISDLEESLSIRLKLLKKNDRLVAESHYQIGTTYAVSGDLDAALDAFKKTLSCLKSLDEQTKLKLDELEKEDSSDKSDKDALKETLSDLVDIIPDIENRIAEIEEDRLEEKMITSSKDEVKPSTHAQSSTSDITHLVRRKIKRPSSDADVGSHLNGSSLTNGHIDLAVDDTKIDDEPLKKEPATKKVKLDVELIEKPDTVADEDVNGKALQIGP
ncbi:unnamed protein product [Protopolystoma xenopodis]|uniref:Uncharacterized protein n=1 Tax=Protopolystoma xenopodis TaxID=117903 RepID=A0A3S5CHL5_9PLAT|nr:unnamed protein product [Protopolystoma xenopodis]